MTCDLSIRERIIRQLLRAVGDALRAAQREKEGGGRVFRADNRGMRDPDSNAPITLGHGDAVLVEGMEQAEDGGQGNEGLTIKTLPATVNVVIRQDETDPRPAASLHNWYILLLERALLADVRVTEEGTQEHLAVDVRVTGTSAPTLTEEEYPAAVGVEIEYEHARDDPGVGPGITQQTEDLSDLEE